MKKNRSFAENAIRELKRRIEKSDFITLKPNEQFLIFYLKLNEYFFTHNMMDLKVEIVEERYFPFCSRNRKHERLVQCPCIKIFDKDLCNVTFIPKTDGIELFRLEVYNPGKGVGSVLMNVFNTISKSTGIKIFTIPAEPGFNNPNSDPEKRRNFYHKFGFMRNSDSRYWSN